MTAAFQQGAKHAAASQLLQDLLSQLCQASCALCRTNRDSPGTDWNLRTVRVALYPAPARHKIISAGTRLATHMLSSKAVSK